MTELPREAMPTRIMPMLATLAKELPGNGDEWSFEVKWDGVRALAYVEHGELRLESRNLLDVTHKYPELHGLAGALGDHSALLDGEIVAFDADGKPSFGAWQRRGPGTPIAYLLFDLLHLDGRSTRGLPYRDRRAALEGLDLEGPTWRIPAIQVGDGEALLDAVTAQGLEGVMAKRLDGTYEPGRRAKHWRKIKVRKEQELVIGGWLPGEGNRTNRLGALLLGYYDDDGGGLQSAGRVGTGFTDKELAKLQGLLADLATDTSPFAERIPLRAARFVRPELVARVEFSEWTHNGTLRHPAYKGLRTDKNAQDVRREREVVD